MWPATIGVLSLSAILFLFGVLSARQSRRAREKSMSIRAAQLKEASQSSHNGNRENPSAMAMSGETKANLVKVSGR